MLRRCVNPFCNCQSHSPQQGKLFVIELPERVMGRLSPQLTRREEFWLCEKCDPLMTVAVRRDTDPARMCVRIINLPESGATKLKFPAPEIEIAPKPTLAYSA